MLALVAACGGGEIGDGTPGDGNPASGDGPNTTDGMAPRDVPGANGEPANLIGITLAHNQVRNDVQTANPLPFMTWNDDLAATAAAWAAQCIDQDGNGLIDHNPGRSTGHPYYVGENIYGSGGTANVQQAVDLWASEEANYNYANNSCSGVCGHYTQLVWRTSVELGCAVADCNGQQFGNAIICNYGPGGNSGGPPY
jgi:pathogenesis-related protein 1